MNFSIVLQSVLDPSFLDSLFWYVVSALVLVLVVVFAYKSIDLGKRGVKKA